MTQTPTHHRSARPRGGDEPRRRAAVRLDPRPRRAERSRIAAEITRRLDAPVPARALTEAIAARTHDLPVVSDFVRTAVETLAAAGFDAVAAARSMRRAAVLFGRDLATEGIDEDLLDRGFGVATATACDLLDAGAGDLSPQARRTLRGDLALYVRALRDHARQGRREMHEVLLLPREARTDLLADAAFGARPAGLLECAAQVLEVPLDSAYVAVAAVRSPLPAALASAPGALRGPTRHEVLLPAATAVGLVRAWLAERPDVDPGSATVVTGPITELTQCPGAVLLVRRAAALLREDAVGSPGRLVEATDLLGALLVRGNRLLADLVVAKHLAPLAELSAARRLRLAEIVLNSLESKLPLNQLARQLGIPAQTAHSRMQSARALLGDTLDDPEHHLELIVALRSALPRWREDASA